MTHYSTGQKPHLLWPAALELAPLVIAEFKSRQAIPVLCYQGMSGVSSATALMLALRQYDTLFPFVMCYVRKKDEQCHSTYTMEWEAVGSLPDLPWVGLFVDDFGSSGQTFKRCIRETKKGLPGMIPSKPILWNLQTKKVELKYPASGLISDGVPETFK